MGIFMDKIDILMAILGAAAYVAIMVDLRNYERKMAAFEAVQEKRRKYAELQAERRKAELAMEKSMKQVENTKKSAQLGEDILERVGKA